MLVGTEVMTAELEVVACGRTAWPLWRCAGSGLDVEYISVLVDRAPKIVLLAADADKDLVHVPPVARLRPAPLQHLGEDPAEARAPLADALVADHDPTLGQDQLNITQAQTEAMKEPQGMLDDLGREAEATIWFETSSCRAACHGLEEAANLTLPTTLVALTRSDGRQDTREAKRNESPGGRCYVAMAIPGTLTFGPLTNRTLHLCIDMQNLFAEATPWHTPWMARVLPVVEAIAASHAERTVFTRFVPPVKADEMPGTWRRYYQRWRDLTLERLDPRLIDLVPELARLVPPAVVIDKHVYSPFVERGLLRLLRERRTDALVITGAETDVCVLAAVLGAIDFGYRVVLATDALCSSSDATHDALLGLYRRRFGEQIETADSETILASWR
jgi:nicotinamidase-related amidase